MAYLTRHPSEVEATITELALAWGNLVGPRGAQAASAAAGLETGLLRQSITWENIPDRRVVRWGSNVEYAALHEVGRGWVFPDVSKVLRWIVKATGREVFARRARPYPGRHYLLISLRVLGLRGVRSVSNR